MLGRNLDNLNLDMCMELLEQTPRGQRAAQLGPGGRQDGSRPLRHEHRAPQRLGRLLEYAEERVRTAVSAPPRSRSLSTYTPQTRQNETAGRALKLTFQSCGQRLSSSVADRSSVC